MENGRRRQGRAVPLRHEIRKAVGRSSYNFAFPYINQLKIEAHFD